MNDFICLITRYAMQKADNVGIKSTVSQYGRDCPGSVCQREERDKQAAHESRCEGRAYSGDIHVQDTSRQCVQDPCLVILLHHITISLVVGVERSRLFDNRSSERFEILHIVLLSK